MIEHVLIDFFEQSGNNSAISRTSISDIRNDLSKMFEPRAATCFRLKELHN